MPTFEFYIFIGHNTNTSDIFIWFRWCILHLPLYTCTVRQISSWSLQLTHKHQDNICRVYLVKNRSQLSRADGENRRFVLSLRLQFDQRSFLFWVNDLILLLTLQLFLPYFSRLSSPRRLPNIIFPLEQSVGEQDQIKISKLSEPRVIPQTHQTSCWMEKLWKALTHSSLQVCNSVRSFLTNWQRRTKWRLPKRKQAGKLLKQDRHFQQSRKVKPSKLWVFIIHTIQDKKPQFYKT